MTATDEFTFPHVKTTRPRVAVSEAFYAWADRHFASRRHASKILARHASHGDHQVSPRTAESWLRRRSVPTMDSIEIMAARCDDLFAELEKERTRLRDLLR